MTKRLRSSSTAKIAEALASDAAARKAGLKAYEYAEGRAWLWKALNPQNTENAAVGIPSHQTNNISCLNYQSQYDITPPGNISATAPSYDVDLFLNHNPLLFGCAITSPTGTMDLSEIGALRIAIDTGSRTITLTPEDSPMKTVALRTTTQLINTQINPEVFKYSGSLASRRVLFSQLTQKNRMAYGSALAIPTCSDLNNGGLITACQQICEPQRTLIDSAKGVYLNSYATTDFPDVSDTIQNPQMYSARYNDGCYMPYKMREPFTQGYTNSEREVTCRAPYVVTGISAICLNSYASTTSGSTFGTQEQFFSVDNASTTFSAVASFPAGITAADQMQVLALKVYVTNYLGQRGYYYISKNLAGSSGKYTSTFTPAIANDISNTLILNSSQVGAALGNVFNGPVFEGPWPAGRTKFPTTTAVSSPTTFFGDTVIKTNEIIRIPEIVTFYDSQGTADFQNPNGLQFGSLDITVGGTGGAERGTIPDMLENQMATVHMTGVSNTAPVKLILKMGIEILLTAGSPYSPFKFISPKYDESALKSYLRCTRVMRDAYFAAAGGAGGQVEFMRALNDLIENDTSLPLSRVLNQGGNYVSVIG